jgi:DNA invertase Pin-like site-specific DNA recombinase
MGNGLRLLLAARKSRKATDADVQAMYERQDNRARQWAEREGHTIVSSTADTKTGSSAPWKRKQLKPWMTDPSKMAMYDAILVSNTDRLSRGSQEDFMYIEHWATEHGKRIIVARGPQYPARTDSERGDWDAQKRAAFNELQSTRERHADTREIVRDNGSAIGRAPFGYSITGEKLHKQFVIDPVNGPLAKTAFKRMAQGATATSVAVWLTERTGQMWRVKRVCDMIARRTYLGERDGHKFEALVSQALWDAANGAMATRSFARAETGGRRTEHGYSGLVYCQCGASLYHHQSSRDGKPVGQAKYRCSRGRSGDVTEARCSNEPALFAPVNEAIDRLIARQDLAEMVTMTTGGDHGRQLALQALQEAMKDAAASMDMPEVTRVAASISELQGMSAEPIRTVVKDTGRDMARVWSEGDLSDRRSILATEEFHLILKDGQVSFRWESETSATWRITMHKGWHSVWDSEPVMCD